MDIDSEPVVQGRASSHDTHSERVENVHHSSGQARISASEDLAIQRNNHHSSATEAEESLVDRISAEDDARSDDTIVSDPVGRNGRYQTGASRPRHSSKSRSENFETRNGGHHHSLPNGGDALMASDESDTMSVSSMSDQVKKGLRLLITDTPRMNLILSFLTLSQILAMMVVEKNAKRAVRRFFHTMEILNFSEFYGVIGSQNLDATFYDLISSFTNVRQLSFRFCTQLKSMHLDRILAALCPSGSEENHQIEKLDLFFCSKLTSNAPFKISGRLPNLKYLDLGRCHQITSSGNINGLKSLLHLPLEYLGLSLNPDLNVNDAIEIVSLLIHDDSFRHLRVLDLRFGCELLANEQVDLDDLFERGFAVRLPPSMRRLVRSG